MCVDRPRRSTCAIVLSTRSPSWTWLAGNLTYHISYHPYRSSYYHIYGVYYVGVVGRIISGKLFNQSWVELDEEIRSLAIKSGYATLTE